MHFSTHTNNLIRSVRESLQGDRQSIVNGMGYALLRAADLFRTDEFNFWLKQLETIDAVDLPMTRYGLREAQATMDKCSATRATVRSDLGYVSELLFTYCDGDDLDFAQFDNHYYYHKPSKTVFKMSGLGIT